MSQKQVPLDLNLASRVSAFTINCYSAAILLALFEAPLSTPGSFRLVEILLLVLLAWVLLVEQRIYVPSKSIISFLVLFYVLFTLTIGIIGQMILSLPLESFVQGYAPAARIGIYSLFFWLGYHILVQKPGYYLAIIRILIISFLVHGTYALIQFCAISFDLPPLDSLPYIPIYQFIDGSTQTVDYAATGFTGAVYTLAEYGIQTVIIGISLFVSRFWSSWQAGFFILLGYLMVLSTYRRSQLIAVVIVTMVLILVNSGSVGKKISYVFILLFLLNIPFSLTGDITQVNPTLGNRIYSIQLLVLGETDNALLDNWVARTEGTWSTYLKLASEYPYGTGLYPPNILEEGSDSAYLTHLVWGGLPLVFLYVMLIVVPLIFAFKLTNAGQNLSKEQIISRCLIIGLSLSILITSFAGGGIFSLPSLAMFWIALALLNVFLFHPDPGIDNTHLGDLKKYCS